MVDPMATSAVKRPAAAPSGRPGAAAPPAREERGGQGARALSLDHTRRARRVASSAADATGEAARKRSLQPIVPAENMAADECLHATGGRTPKALLSVLDGWRELALANPAPPRAAGARRERGQPAGARDCVHRPTQHPRRGQRLPPPLRRFRPRAPARPQRRGATRDDQDPQPPTSPGSYATPGAFMTPTGTHRKSRSAGSRTSNPSGATSRKSYSNKHIPMI